MDNTSEGQHAARNPSALGGGDSTCMVYARRGILILSRALITSMPHGRNFTGFLKLSIL
jgi:hypothetical protein